MTFNATDASYIFGFAASGTSVTDPTDSTSALSYHSEGYGEYSVNLTNAYSSNYATWASWATASNTTTSSSNSTTSSSGSSSSNSTLPAATTSNTTYDAIICGGGPAGIIVAERLAETGASVLLIERGPASTVETGATGTLAWNDSLTKFDLPALGSSLTKLSDVSEFCTDTASTAGCLLGGSSSVNALNFIHPQTADFDDKWPTGWKWSDVSAAAERLYTRNPGTTTPSVDGKHYDQDGFNIMSSFLTSFGWSQIDSIESPNAKTKAFSQPAWSIKDDKRAGPVRTYLPLVLDSDNFTLQLETKVIQVVRSGSTVTGVLVENSDGTTEIINLNDGGKVVLSAGALSTPRILWNSGIGMSDALEVVQSGSTGVSLPNETDWISLPVGHNMKDHPQYVLTFDTATNFTAYDWSTVYSGPAMSDQELYNASTGTLTQAAQRMHLWTSDNATTDGVTRFFQGTVSALSNGVVTVKAFLTHGATSTGVLGITSSGSTEVVTGPWMNTDADRTAMTKFLQWLLDSASLSNSTISYTGGNGINASTLIDTHITGDHWTGTAKMGSDSGLENGTAVVDLDTKVYGTDNLFVVDASIHPDLPTGNTQAIIMIAAEQAAQKISNYTVTADITGAQSAASSAAAASASTAPYSNSTVSVTSVAAVASSTSAVATITGSTFTTSATTLATVVASSSAGVATGSAAGESATATATGSTSTSTAVVSGSTGSTGSSSGSTSGSSYMMELIDLIIELIEDLVEKKSSS